MLHSRTRNLITMLGALLALGLTACEREYWPLNTLVTGATENPSEGLPDGTRKYERPFNVWVDNPKLANAIRIEIKEGGREELVCKYEFQCVPRPCEGCLSCTATFWQWEHSKVSIIKPGFVHRGDALVSVQIGPGTAVSAMTYWTK